jgi:hypothetical protein
VEFQNNIDKIRKNVRAYGNAQADKGLGFTGKPLNFQSVGLSNPSSGTGGMTGAVTRAKIIPKAGTGIGVGYNPTTSGGGTKVQGSQTPQPEPTVYTGGNQGGGQQSGSQVDLTIDDIASKYGFDFSSDYAKKQAAAEAQAKRNTYNNSLNRAGSQRDQNLQAIDNRLVEQSQALEHDYFQQYLQQQQALSNAGLNAGIASDQNLRLNMAQQGAMGGAFRDANLGRMQVNQNFTNEDARLREALGLVNQEELAYADRLLNNLRQQGFQNLMTHNGMQWGQQMDWANMMGEWNAGVPSWFQGNLPQGTVQQRLIEEILRQQQGGVQ